MKIIKSFAGSISSFIIKKGLIIGIVLFSSVLSLKAQWSGTNPLLTDSNVGIGTGTSSPLDKLHIIGHISIQPDGSNAPSYINFKRISDGWNAARIGQAYSQLGYGGHLVFETNASASIANLVERMRITYDGNVGIGTTTPTDKLHVNGNVSIQPSGSGVPSYINFKRPSDGWNAARIGQAYSQLAYGGHLVFETNASASATDLVERMRITYDGKVGIGTTSFPGTHKLYVSGGIIAEQVTVKLQGNWPDYVFEKATNLKPLSEVESYINKNKHLPEIPSAAEVQANGINLGEMDALLLKKIEELTLYMIEMKKEAEEMKEKNNQMEMKNKALEKEIEILKTK